MRVQTNSRCGPCALRAPRCGSRVRFSLTRLLRGHARFAMTAWAWGYSAGEQGFRGDHSNRPADNRIHSHRGSGVTRRAAGLPTLVARNRTGPWSPQCVPAAAVLGSTGFDMASVVFGVLPSRCPRAVSDRNRHTGNRTADHLSARSVSGHAKTIEHSLSRDAEEVRSLTRSHRGDERRVTRRGSQDNEAVDGVRQMGHPPTFTT